VKIDPQEFKPRVHGVSDFYSWNLYRWLKNNTHMNRIWLTPENVFLPEKGTLVIGSERDGQWIHGSRLIAVCNSRKSLQSWAYHGGFKTPEWKDVTEEFFAQYATIGVCAIHRDNAHKWNIDGDTRVCEYCGKVEKKTIEFREHVTWV
jgi:hypothetical protein